jgi:hypothetical protein
MLKVSTEFNSSTLSPLGRGNVVKVRKNLLSECHPVLVTGSKDCPKGLFFRIYWILIQIPGQARNDSAD